VIVEPGEDVPVGRTVLRASNAYLAFAKISTAFHPPREAVPEIAPGAAVHPTAKVHPGAQVMALASIGPRAEVGARTIVFPGAHVCEDDVEIGANSCVDRATLGVTRIGRGAKIGDLVMIAHNVEVGPLSILASQVGISGSTKLGMGVVAWGQAGIVGHLTIGDRANVAAQAGVTQDVEPGARVAGSPAGPDVQWARNAAVFNRLTDMRRELRQLRKELDALRADKEKMDA